MHLDHAPVIKRFERADESSRRVYLVGRELVRGKVPQRAEDRVLGTNRCVVARPRTTARKAPRVGIPPQRFLHEPRLGRINAIHVASKNPGLDCVCKHVRGRAVLSQRAGGDELQRRDRKWSR